MDHEYWCSEGDALDESGFEVECDEYDKDMKDRIYSERRARTEEKRNLKKQINDAVCEKLRLLGIVTPTPSRQASRGAKVEVNCKCCGNKFMARVADRKRGWGKFCSKSCKAKSQ